MIFIHMHMLRYLYNEIFFSIYIFFHDWYHERLSTKYYTFKSALIFTYVRVNIIRFSLIYIWKKKLSQVLKLLGGSVKKRRKARGLTSYGSVSSLPTSSVSSRPVTRHHDKRRSHVIDDRMKKAKDIKVRKMNVLWYYYSLFLYKRKNFCICIYCTW